MLRIKIPVFYGTAVEKTFNSVKIGRYFKNIIFCISSLLPRFSICNFYCNFRLEIHRILIRRSKVFYCGICGQTTCKRIYITNKYFSSQRNSYSKMPVLFFFIVNKHNNFAFYLFII